MVMSLERWFRLLSSLTLGLSCSALVFAEVPFLPNLPICLPPVLILLVLAWWVEGRWRLPNWGANILGLFIAGGGIVWLLGQFADEESLLVRLPLQLAMLPYMGPLLMAALLVKVFGGSLDAGDFWRLHGLGLLQISLGCVLDGGPVFGALMAGYLLSGVACLALRYRLQVDGRGPATAGRHLGTNPSSAAAAISLPVRWLFSFMLRWSLLLVLPALVLFLLTPRSDSSAWQPLGSFRAGSGQMRTVGGSEEINLNTTGRIEVDDEIAFEVSAVDAQDRPKLDVPAEQRWRGVVLDSYDNGKWTPLHAMPLGGRRWVQTELPDFGPQQWFLTYRVRPRQTGALVLAEPVRLGERPREGESPRRLPVVTLSTDGRPRLFTEATGCVLPLAVRTQREYRYRQVVPALEMSERTPAEGLRSGHVKVRLITLPPQLDLMLRDWSLELLGRLSKDERYQVPRAVRAALAQPHDSFLIDPEDWEGTARALSNYLAHSGEFTYTLDLTRSNFSLDPVVDFLFHVKKGHCERYAAGLTLMLRSLGIPARVVKGFRGCENVGDGMYVVRHYHAHAWVEILAPRADGKGKQTLASPSSADDGMPSSEEIFADWLSLDPTPAESAAASRVFSLAHLLQDIPRLLRQGWQNLIVDYNADDQADLWDTLKAYRRLESLARLSIPAAVVLAIVAVALLLRLWPRRKPAVMVVRSPMTTLYLRLVRILGRHARLHPRLNQTPREYGEAARTFLHARPALRTLAELPMRVVELLYQERFGGRELRGEELYALHTELGRFKELIRQQGRHAQTEPQP